MYNNIDQITRAYYRKQQIRYSYAQLIHHALRGGMSTNHEQETASKYLKQIRYLLAKQEAERYIWLQIAESCPLGFDKTQENGGLQSGNTYNTFTMEDHT